MKDEEKELKKRMDEVRKKAHKNWKKRANNSIKDYMEFCNKLEKLTNEYENKIDTSWLVGALMTVAYVTLNVTYNEIESIFRDALEEVARKLQGVKK